MAPAGKLAEMKIFAFATIALLVTVAKGQDRVQGARPPVVERLCGKLLHSEQVPIKNAVNTFEDKTRNLAHVTVKLYRADDDRLCCNGLSLAAETKTGRWGSFRLREKGLVGGVYWIVVRPTSREYRLLIRYEPKKNSDELCSQSLFELNDAGNFWKAEIVVLD